MDDMDLLMEEEEIAGEGERQNRTFILLVAGMGGLLLIGIVAFCIWAAVFGPRMMGGQVALPPTETPTEIVSPEAIAEVGAGGTATAAAAAATAEAAPTHTPVPPTATRLPTASPTPEAAEVAEVTPTTGVAPAERTTTPAGAGTPAAEDGPAPTGIGALTAVVLASGLLLLVVVARRLRAAH
jgi:hypothetical protein